jgi:hypothetical protein
VKHFPVTSRSSRRVTRHRVDVFEMAPERLWKGLKNGHSVVEMYTLLSLNWTSKCGPSRCRFCPTVSTSVGLYEQVENVGQNHGGRGCQSGQARGSLSMATGPVRPGLEGSAERSEMWSV